MPGSLPVNVLQAHVVLLYVAYIYYSSSRSQLYRLDSVNFVDSFVRLITPTYYIV
jgi:hypothetical protein